MAVLRDYLPRHTYAVAGAYRGDRLVSAVGGAQVDDDDGLVLQFPRVHPFLPGDKITVHLDNRMQVNRYTDQLPVYRTSYKGEVVEADTATLEVRPVHFQLFHSYRCVEEFRIPGYEFPADDRHRADLPVSPLTSAPALRNDEAGAHLGVFLTWAADRPHSTVMAFLSSQDGDIFLITDPASFKGHNLYRDPRGVFAVDFRATYDLAKPLDWAYRLQSVLAHQILRSSPLFTAVRDRFLEKNPWEGAFFAAPTSILLHLIAEH